MKVIDFENSQQYIQKLLKNIRPKEPYFTFKTALNKKSTQILNNLRKRR